MNSPHALKTLIIVIEDLPSWQMRYSKELAGAHVGEILKATNFEVAEELIVKHLNPEADAILILDGSISGTLDALRLLKIINSRGFKGPVIAAAGSPEDNEILCGAECCCTHNSGGKEKAVALAMKILSEK